MKRQKKGLSATAVAVGALALGLTASANADILIDDFGAVADPNPWPISLSEIGTEQVDELGLGAGTAGAARTTILETTFIDLDGLDEVNVTVAAGAGVLDFASTVGAAGNLSLIYDAGTGDLGMNMSNETDILIDFSLFDYPDGQALDTTITLWDGTESADLTIALEAAGAQTVAFSLADFNNIGSLDLSSINSIEVLFEGSLATDFRVTQIYTIPAPGALALLGVAGLAGSRRRRG